MLTTSSPLTNWAGNVRFQATRVHRPRSLDELRRLVADSRLVRPVGSTHSFSRVADTVGELVSLRDMPRHAVTDPATATVTVSGGMTYAEVVAHLHGAGWALANMASLPHISVAGSIATGTHGSGRGQRSLAAAVAGLRMVGADGELVEVSRQLDGDRLRGSVVALGALGVVTEVTLDVEPAYRMTQRVHVDVPLAELPDGLEAMFGAAYSVSLFTDWLAPRAHVYLKDRVDDPAPAWPLGRIADEPVHPVPGMPTEFCTGQLDVPGWWHERLPHFRAEFVPGAGQELQSEYFVGFDRAAEAMSALIALGEVIAPAVHIAEVRCVRGDELWLSPAYGRDTVTFHFTWYDDLAAITPAMAAVEAALAPLDARPHWGKLTGLSPADIIGRYPRAADFRALRDRTDPDGRFTNPMVSALFPPRP